MSTQPLASTNAATSTHSLDGPWQRRAEENPSRVQSTLKRLQRRLPEINKEVWLVLSLILISAFLNFMVSSNRMVLGFYTLPTLFSAYLYGRRHATLTAFGSILLIILVVYYNPGAATSKIAPGMEQWLEIAVWGGILILTGYAMGTLYEHKQAQVRELRQTYNGVLMILQQFISKDKYTQNHSYRVSVYATKVAAEMGLPEDRIEDVRSAALLHDIGKLDVSRDVLYKASRLSEEEFGEMRQHVARGVTLLEPVGGSLRRILPIILAHHDKYDGSGYHPIQGEEIPLEARILSVADVYDALTSDRPYRQAMSPFEAKAIIEKERGKDFDPRVVASFLSVFRKGQMEVPEVLV